MQSFGIGELSKRSSCHIETVRYYERVGLLPLPPRSSGGHRLYTDVDTQRVCFIRRSRELGFSLNEIRELLALVDGANFTCAEVKSITLNHADAVHSKIEDLTNIESVLRSMAAKCRRGNVPKCPIIDTLNEAIE